MASLTKTFLNQVDQDVACFSERIQYGTTHLDEMRKAVTTWRENKECEPSRKTALTWTKTTAGSSFNALVNSGIVHPTAVLICPFIGAVANSGFAYSQWKSPFDTCPATLSALSLTNLQVSIGGQNVLNSTLNMTCEIFLQQVNLAEQLTCSDFGVSTGNQSRILGSQQMVFCNCRTWQYRG